VPSLSSRSFPVTHHYLGESRTSCGHRPSFWPCCINLVDVHRQMYVLLAMSLRFVTSNPFCIHLSMGSYLSSTYHEYLPSNSSPMASSSQQFDSLSDDPFNQDNDESSDQETPTLAAVIWEPRKIRAKVGGSYWVVDNEQRCVAFCKMQMTVCAPCRCH